MALIDVVSHELQADTELIWKFQSTELALGTQLIVREGQAAIFMKGGEALDVFYSGTHTLTTGNIPLLNNLINLPFGNQSPFSAEVWFVNTTVNRALKWGTSAPIPVMDPKLGFPVSVRSFGRWGIRITDPRLFLIKVVGPTSNFQVTGVYEYFIGQIRQLFSQVTSSLIATDKLSILGLMASSTKISATTSVMLSDSLNKLGVELVSFDIESITIPNEELQKVQNVFEKTLEARELSALDLSSSYRTVKTFEVLNNAASNQSDSGMGAFLAAGVGIGAGGAMGNELVGGLKTEPTEQAMSKDLTVRSTSERLKQLTSLLNDNLITEDEFQAKRAEILRDI
ncbi:MAG: membrane protease subunit (stomatin/prohibitin family) [Marinoscillum sp.]|jgi:membrane protease subunit (stomatin/prohibitin family)